MRTRDAAARLRSLVAAFVALALLLAPAFTHLGMAGAAAPKHERMMKQAGRCSISADGLADHGKPAGKACCSSTSLAVAADAVSPLQETPVRGPARAVPVPSLHIGYLGEIATPPPRIV